MSGWYAIFIVSFILYVGMTCGGQNRFDDGLSVAKFKVSPPPQSMTRAELYLWSHSIPQRPNGALIVVPGLNGDGRDVFLDMKWRSFAKEHGLFLIGVSFASVIDGLRAGKGYYYPEQGSGIVLLDGLRTFKCENVPLFLYGFSGGAHFVSRFVQWHPQNVRAWCAYAAAWWTMPVEDFVLPPGIVACGGDDFRVTASRNYFHAGRERGAQWLWVEMAGVGHVRSYRLEDFFRSYARVLLVGKMNEGVWVNVLSGEQETMAFQVKSPCAMGWLPDRPLYCQWLKLCWKGGRW